MSRLLEVAQERATSEGAKAGPFRYADPLELQGAIESSSGFFDTNLQVRSVSEIIEIEYFFPSPYLDV